MDQINMKLLIIGGGNVGGFVINNINHFTEDFEVMGILDDDTSKQNTSLWDIPVIGTTQEIERICKLYPKIGFVLSIASPLIKKTIFESVAHLKGIEFPNIIHKNCWLSNNVMLGRGNIIYPGASINYEAAVCNFTTLNMNVSVGHNCLINDFSTLSPGVNIAGFTDVGESTFLGIGSCSKQGHTIGSKSTIGAGTVIIKDVPAGATVVGNPGRIIKIQ